MAATPPPSYLATSPFFWGTWKGATGVCWPTLRTWESGCGDLWQAGTCTEGTQGKKSLNTMCSHLFVSGIWAELLLQPNINDTCNSCYYSYNAHYSGRPSPAPSTSKAHNSMRRAPDFYLPVLLCKRFPDTDRGSWMERVCRKIWRLL